MAQKTTRPSEENAVIGSIAPGAKVAATYITPWITMANFQAVMAVVQTGVLGSGATVDAKLEQAQDETGTGATDLGTVAITQMTAPGDDSKQAILECYAEDLDLKNEFTHVRLSVTVGVATSDASAVIFGLKSRYKPASDYGADSVTQIVSA